MVKLYYSFIETPPEEYIYPAYRYAFVPPNQLRQIEHLHKGFGFWPLVHLLFRHERCYAVWDGNRIASFLMIGTSEVRHLGTRFPLARNEAHLYFSYTLDEYRGKGYATALRYRVYDLLAREGRDTIYSFTAFNNTAALRFKDKIHARRLGLHIFVKIFRLKFAIKLRTYDQMPQRKVHRVLEERKETEQADVEEKGKKETQAD